LAHGEETYTESQISHPEQHPSVQENEVHVPENSPVYSNVDTSFHFALQNVNDEIVRTQRDMADESRPVLEQILSMPLLDKSFTSTHSSPRSSVPETQVVVGNSSDINPELRMDLDLVRHVLVQ